jgi:predicted ATP-grasp superfamily ATP-dependent carboligase
MKVFVTDGRQRPALAIARSLGRRGVPVLVGAETPASLASSSRYCERHVTYPSPEQDQKAFDHFVLGFARRGEADVIVPVTDVAMAAITANQHALRHHCALACPPFSAFEAVTDKWSLVRRAREFAVPVPRTRFVDGLSDLRRVPDLADEPAVVKPIRSRVRTGAGWTGTNVHYVHSGAEMRRLYEETEYLQRGPSLIQQRIVGPGLAIFVLFEHGRLLTDFAHRRLREKPPSGGASVVSESVAVDPRLREFAVRLLGPLGWHGVAMLEFKQDARTGDLYLIEVNGRFWGSLQLAIAAGVDFPFLTYQLAIGERPSVPSSYTVGVKCRWLLGDFDHLLIRLAHSARHLNLADTAPSRLRVTLDFLKLIEPRLHYEIISTDDPAPFLYELSEYATSLLSCLTQRLRHHRAVSWLPPSGGSSTPAAAFRLKAEATRGIRGKLQ